MLSAQMQKKYKIDWKYNQLIAFLPNCPRGHTSGTFFLYLLLFYTLCNSSHHFAHFENKKKCRTFKTFNFSLAALLVVQMVLLSVVYNHFFKIFLNFLIIYLISALVCLFSFFSIKHDLARSCFRLWPKIGDEGDKILREKNWRGASRDSFFLINAMVGLY